MKTLQDIEKAAEDRKAAGWRKSIMLHPPLFCIMQAVGQQKKTVTVSADVHKKIVSLRRGDQTYGDVIAELIKAHEEAEQCAGIPCIDEKYLEELDGKEAAWDADPDTHYSSFDEIDTIRAKQKGKV
jgi:predicted CopG family antitoxin